MKEPDKAKRINLAKKLLRLPLFPYLLLFAGDIPRGVFVNEVHRKNEKCGAKSCECMISVHREACYCERSEQ